MKNPGLLRAIQHAADTSRQRQHLHCAGYDHYRCKVADPFLYRLYQPFAVGGSAGENDLIDLPVHNG